MGSSQRASDLAKHQNQPVELRGFDTPGPLDANNVVLGSYACLSVLLGRLGMLAGVVVATSALAGRLPS